MTGGTFESLSIPAFRRLWIGGLLYFLSIFAQMIARGALAKELTGSNAALGAVTLAFGLTGIVSTPLGGVAADRFPKRTVMQIASGLLLTSSLWIALAVQFDVIEFWMLLVASAIQSVGFSGLAPARMAFTAEIVGRDLIANGVVLSQISMNVNRVAGPVIAGVMLAAPAAGISGVYWLGTALTAASMLLFATLPSGAPAPDAARRSPVAEVVGGVRYAANDQTLRLLLVTSTLIIMLGFSYVAFLPSVAEDFFQQGSSGFAWLSALAAIGGLIASLLVAGRASGEIAWRIQLWAAVGFGVGVAALGWAPTFALALAISLPLGAATAAFQSMNATLMLVAAEPEYHGRMQSLLQLGFNLFGIAAYPMGVLADWWGLRETLVAMGILTALVGLASGLLRSSVTAGDP